VNTRIWPAVRWRAGVTSLQMWAQMAMRILVIAVGLWATSAVALVWYWVRRYAGWAAHEYFVRWILAWALTQVPPLLFLSLPYRGERYPAGSMYNQTQAPRYSTSVWAPRFPRSVALLRGKTMAGWSDALGVTQA
jgi:hypothetical protein